MLCLYLRVDTGTAAVRVFAIGHIVLLSMVLLSMVLLNTDNGFTLYFAAAFSLLSIFGEFKP